MPRLLFTQNRTHPYRQLLPKPKSPACDTPTTGLPTPPLRPTIPNDSIPSEQLSRRRASHSLIERRRRLRINQRLTTLKHIIPSCEANQQMPQLSVLQRAIEYILELQMQLQLITHEDAEGYRRSVPDDSAEDEIQEEMDDDSPETIMDRKRRMSIDSILG